MPDLIYTGAMFWLLGFVFLLSIGFIVNPLDMDMAHAQKKASQLLLIDIALFLVGFAFVIAGLTS